MDKKWTRNKTIIFWSSSILILILLIIVVIFATQPSQEPVITPDISATLEKALADALGPPTATTTSTLVPPINPTVTNTLTPLPTLTSTPSITPTITVTGSYTPPPPTLTPVLPGNEAEAFQLNSLIPSQYNYAIALMEGVPQLLPGGQENEAYYDSYYHAEVIQSEAILRYPNNENSNTWRWSEALNLARIDDTKAQLAYATLLSRMINENGISLEDIPSEVKVQDPNLRVDIQEISPYVGNIQNSLVELMTPGGSIYFWYTETNDDTTFYTLSDEADFSDPTTSRLFWSDLSGDGIKELIIYTPNKDFRILNLPKVFNLTNSPPNQLHFNPNEKFEIGLENNSDWGIAGNEENFYNLEFEAVVYPPCPVTVNHRYQWSGTWLNRVDESYEVQPVTQLIEYCELIVDQASTVWGMTATIQIMESLLPYWPPQSTVEKTYPPDALDQWRYRLGVYHTLMGSLENASVYFQNIVQSPATPESQWIKSSKEFLDSFQTPWGIYSACVASKYCDNRVAFKNWISSLTKDEAKDALFYLSSKGVAIRYSDVFDFDGDGTQERWFTFRHSYLERLELWILLINDTGAQALFVDTVDTNQPTLTRYTDLNGLTYVWIGSQQSFQLKKSTGSSDSYIKLLPPSYYYARLTSQITETSIDALLSGFSPNTILDRLIDHRDSTDFACLNKEDCARFYYALGLAAELAGNEELAIEAYLKIWWDSFESPFSTIARLKLGYKTGYGPLATETPPPTNTPTRTPTLTPTPTSTLSATSTGTPTSTSTPTTTEDPNMTWTPSPTVTDTPTSTSTTDTSSDPYP